MQKINYFLQGIRRNITYCNVIQVKSLLSTDKECTVNVRAASPVGSGVWVPPAVSEVGYKANTGSMIYPRLDACREGGIKRH